MYIVQMDLRGTRTWQVEQLAASYCHMHQRRHGWYMISCAKGYCIGCSEDSFGSTEMRDHLKVQNRQRVCIAVAVAAELALPMAPLLTNLQMCQVLVHDAYKCARVDAGCKAPASCEF